MWRELDKLTDLRVACMAETEPNRDWSVDVSGVAVSTLGARPFSAGGGTLLYGPSSRMFSLFRDFRPDVTVLDGWESPAFWQARLLARRARSRVVLSYWSTSSTHRFRTGPVAAFRRSFFRRADAVITPGEAARETVIAMGVPEERVVTGVGTVDVDWLATGVRAIRETTEPRPGRHFLYVGQLVARKNVQALIEAFAAVRSPGDSLTIVGTGVLDRQLREVAARLAPSAVTFRGHLEGDKLLHAYAAADTLVLPSRQDVWGLVANEALAAGLAVVVSDACGVTPTIRDMPGVFVTAPDTDSLALGIQQSEVVDITDEHPILHLNPKSAARRIVSLARGTS